jgi:hypothetical protein
MQPTARLLCLSIICAVPNLGDHGRQSATATRLEFLILEMLGPLRFFLPSIVVLSVF